MSDLLEKWLRHYDPIHRGWTPAGIANGAVTTAKIAAGAVTSISILDQSVSELDIRDGAVTTAKLHAEAEAEMHAAIERTDGITVAEYNEIGGTARKDQTLMSQLRQIYLTRLETP